MDTAIGRSYVTVRCWGCGRERELTPRQARRAGRCKLCRLLDKAVCSAAEMLWWLELMDDDELAGLLTELSGEECFPGRVAEVRLVLSRQPVRVLSSVSERAGALQA